MIANRFRAVVWSAGVAAAALSCYLVSLQVAAERAQLMKTERRILAARADIKQLRTELDTRSRLVQLERWNADVLGLQAPQVTQYAAGAVELASYAAPRAAPQVIPAVAPAPRPATGAVVQVAAAAPSSAAAARPAGTVTPAAPVQPQQAALRQATYVRPVAQPLLQKASLTLPVAVADPVTLPAAAAPQATPARPRKAGPAPLLADDLLGDIGRAAAAEAGRKVR